MDMDVIYNPNLALYLPLWKRDGVTIRSDDGYGHVCTATGGATWGMGGRTLNGTDGTISVDQSTVFDFTTSFTLALWFKTDNVSQTNTYLINRGNKYAILYEFVDNTVELYAAAGYTGDNPRTGSGLTIADTSWHFILYSYNGSTLLGMLDGETIFSSAKVFTLQTTTTAFIIGGSAASTNCTKGLFGEVLASGRGLTAIEGQNLYIATKDKYR